MLLSQAWNRIVQAALVAPNTAGVIGTFQGLAAVAVCTWSAHAMHQTDGFLQFVSNDAVDNNDDERFATLLVDFTKTFVRSLIVPSLVEEVLWRAVLQPPGTTWRHAVGINLAFALYHMVGSTFLAEHLDGRKGARAVFCDPAFLSLAFCLGNACTWAWIQSGYALWAPVITHAIPVTVWLTCLQGEKALSTPGGLINRT